MAASVNIACSLVDQSTAGMHWENLSKAPHIKLYSHVCTQYNSHVSCRRLYSFVPVITIYAYSDGMHAWAVIVCVLHEWIYTISWSLITLYERVAMSNQICAILILLL